MTWFARCKQRRNYSIAISLVVSFVWAAGGLVPDLGRVVSGIPFILDYLRGMIPPDWSILPSLWEPWLETVKMAIVSITLASVVAVPLAFLAAKDTAPSPWVYGLVRGMVNFLRTIPSLVLAILFISMVGLGPLAGIFALTCHCIGALGKICSEAIESIMPVVAEISEAMRLDGASEWQVLYYALWPEVAPLFAGYILYYFEWAIRISTIMGFVGAGGIGLYLTMSMRLFKRRQTAAIIIAILATVTVVDVLSRQVRRRLV